MNYDVFISYRRDKGAMIARNLQQAMSALGLKVFFDMEELTDGKFNEKLYDSIEQSKNVIFLMTEGALDRCVNDGDWVRNELEHVIDRGKEAEEAFLSQARRFKGNDGIIDADEMNELLLTAKEHCPKQ